MTNAEIDGLSGRDLDAAVERYIFGQTPTPGYTYAVRRFHNDIAVAWPLVAALRAKGYRVIVDLGGLDEKWVEIDRLVTDESDGEERDTWHWQCIVEMLIADDSEAAVCTAICRAALKAREVG